ncbi:MAG: glycosyltransferase family 9 protein [Proteobacteria bacterium]|nr:glycosyltransferase family 9 protein [Pseudomonadota bacterium]
MSSLTDFHRSPPDRVCLLRLSAIGDTCHALAVLRTLQAAWPRTRFTWIIGKLEHKLLSLVPDVEFISYDKRGGFAELRRLRRALAGRRFDLLLHMQLALRASLVSTLVRAPVKLGFDRPRAHELQWLFTTHRIHAAGNQHVLDGFFGFAEALGVHERALRWDFPLPAAAREYADRLVPDRRPTLVISACSSHTLRNWRPEYYAAVADHAAAAYGMRVILAGGPGPVERRMADAIAAAARLPVVDQVGKDTLPQLLALLSRATVLLTPDSGPAHMATAVGVPVIGLYAATRLARCGPYLSRAHCVDRFAEAARRFLGCEPEQVPWTRKIERPGVMDLIAPADVTAKLDGLMRQAQRR